ncbi:MAG: L-fuculokinase [Mangrovibacterium sp.]
MKYFLGIDMGTSYFKAGLFNEMGKLVGLGRLSLKKNMTGKVCELPVSVFWESLRGCIAEAIRNAKINPGEIRTLSYSSQANSFIFLDRYDRPLTPLILWPDRRAEGIDMAPDVIERSDYTEITGLGIKPGSQFVIAKINWFQKMQPQIWAQVKSVMSISDYLVFSLTGQKLSDYSTAAMTGLFNISKRQWYSEMLNTLSLSPVQLSLPVTMGTMVGRLTDGGAQLLGLSGNVSFSTGGLDHQVAAIGAGLPVNNYFSESTGTVLACVCYINNYRPRAGVCSAPGLDDDHFFQMIFDDNGAASLEWYQKKFAPGYSITELVEMAESVEAGSDDLIAAPVVSNFDNLNGFSNIKKYHHHGHFIRAILESTALSLHNILNVLKENIQPAGIVATGGGAKSRLWVQIKANLTGMDFLVPECSESACLGAAALGALGTKEYGSLDEIMRICLKNAERVQPREFRRGEM